MPRSTRVWRMPSAPVLKKAVLVAVLLVISGFAFAYHKDLLQLLRTSAAEAEAMPLLVGAVFIALKTIAAPLGVPGTPLTLLVGSLFGALWGSVIAVIGNTLGAILAFLLARYVLRDYVQTHLLHKYERLRTYEERLEREALPTVIALRFIPLVPFNVLNFLLGVTNIPLRTYALGSFLGMIPGTFAFVYFGESLRMLNPLTIAIAIAGIVSLTYAGKLWERLMLAPQTKKA